MKLKRGEKGFTLIELLVGLSIAALITGAASMTITTMMRLSPQTTNWAIALRQVQNAGYWISRDVQMSQGDIIVGAGNPTFLTLTQPSQTDNITISYQFDDISGGLKRLMRTDQDTGKQIMIAEYISGSNTNANYNSDNFTLTLSVTAISGETTVSRQYEAAQRIRTPSP